MEPVYFEQRKVVEASCHKRRKFGNLPDGNCPHGYCMIMPECRHCVWFSLRKVGFEKKPIIIYRHIRKEDIEDMRKEYNRLSAKDPAMLIDYGEARPSTDGIY